MQIMSGIVEYCICLASLVKSKQTKILSHPKHHATICNPTSPLVSQPWKCLSSTHLGGRLGGSRRFFNCIMPLKKKKTTIPKPSFPKQRRMRPAFPKFLQQGCPGISQAEFLWWLCLKWTEVGYRTPERGNLYKKKWHWWSTSSSSIE